MHAARHRSRRMRALLASVVVAVLGFAPVAVTDAAHAGARHPSAVAAGTFESAPCVVEVPEEHRDRVRCGYLTVAERRVPGADPARTLRLPVAVVPARAAVPVEDPLVFPTTGGPGGGTLDALSYFLDDAYWANADRDVILIEQRGDGLAEPALDCPELHVDAFVDDGVLLTGDPADTRRQALLPECRDRLVEEGVDLSAYTSTASAADLADLRTALGYDAWNLYGLSDGSRLAMTVLRDHPGGLRSVILDGAYPPNVNRYELLPAGFDGALAALFAACEADATCAAAYPALDRTLTEVFDRAASDPFTITVKMPGDRSPVRIALTEGVLARGVFAALEDPDSTRALPFVIDQLANGRADAAVPLAQRVLDESDSLAEGLRLSIECAEEIPFHDDVRMTDAAAAGAFGPRLPSSPVREDCAIWAVPALSEVENAPVASDVPVLILSGGYDPSMPATWAQAAAAGLSRPVAVTLPYAGHGTIRTSECAGYVAAEFLRDPAVAPDASCADRMPATRFLTAADVDPNAAIRRIHSDLVDDRDPVQIAIVGITILFFVLTLLYALGYGLAWLARRRGGAPDGAVLAASVSSAANLAFVGGLLLVLSATDRLILAFGLPPGSWPLFLLPFVGLAAAIVLVVLLVRAWAGGDGSAGDRVFLSLSALGSIGFTVWLLVSGLLTL